MKTFRKLTLLSGLLTVVLTNGLAHGATTVINDDSTVTTSGTGFGLNAGINTGINPPTTRLTGSAAASLRYFQTATNRAASHYDINSNRLRATADSQIGRFVLSANGSFSFDFGPALGSSMATPGNSASYDVKISLRNDATDTARLSFGIATAEGDVNNLDFGVQIFRASSGNSFYTIQKRIDRGSFNGTTTTDGTGDVNATMVTAQANTAATMMDFLIRVTDAGSESGSSYNSRIQVSTNAGSSWIYDTSSDSAVSNRFRFDGTGRHFVFDQAGNTTGSVYYDAFSVTWNSGPRTWNGAGANGNWSNLTNWGGTVPVNGSALIFSGTTRQTNTNDISSLSVPWLNLNTGGFALYGNAFTVTNALTNTTGNSTVNNAITAGGTLRFQSEAGALTLAGNITGGAQNLIVDGAGNTTASGAISGTGSLTKGGAGTLTLSGASANTLSGNSIVNTGIISLGKTSGVNALAGNLTIGDGTGGAGVDIVRLAAANQIADTSAVTVSASGSFDLNGFAETVASVSGANSASQIALGAGTLTTGDGTSATFAGVISGSGNIVKQGSGTLTLSGTNSFSGTATINAGVVNVQNATALGSTGATVVSGGALEVQGGISIASEPLTINGTGISSAGALRNISGNNSWSGAVTLGSAARVNSDSGTLTISGAVGGGQNLSVGGSGNTTVNSVISGTGSLTKDGSGTATLSGASDNVYSGGTTVSAGTLSLAKSAGINAIPGNLTIGDGSGTDVVQLSAANQIADSAAVTISAGGSLDLNGNAETVASVSSASSTSQIALGTGTLTAGDANPATFAGTITGTGNLSKQGAGTLTLSGANSYSGNTTVSAGVLNVQNSSGLGTGGAATVSTGTALELQGGITVAGQSLTVNGTGISSGGALRNISGNNSWSGSVTLGSATTIQSDSGTLTLGGVAGSGQNLTVGGAGNTTVGGVISGSGTLTKAGNGILTLSGANTYSGDTTISAGTLALGTGGSISSSPTITIANSTTFDVSAVSFSLGSGKTLARNSTSSSGSVNGSMTLSSGAAVSLLANGSGTVGSISVTGGLTLNNNVITVNVSGSALGAGTYSLITYTGSKTGSFNATPTITGSGLGSGLSAKIVETSGVISLNVYVPTAPAHGISAASIKVVENDLANTTNSVTVTTTTSINGLQIRDGSNRGDITVQVGASGTDDLAAGVLLSCVSQNGKDQGEDSGTNFCTSAISSTSGGYFIPTATVADGTEYNINIGAAYFPYNKYLGGYARNSAGTEGGANDLLTASSGINLGTQFVDNGGGTSTVNLASFGINSQTDGVLLVTAGANNNHFALAGANTNGTWTVYVKDDTTDGAVYDRDPVAFVFIPKTNVSVISGKFDGNENILMYSGASPQFSITNTTNGTWQLTIPGYSPSSGVLIISAEGGNGANVDNIVSYQSSGNNWLIQSRDLPGAGLQALTTQSVVSFVFIPAPTITLVTPANNSTVSSSPTLKVTATNQTGNNMTVTFYGHNAGKPGPGDDFLIPVLPDTQNYSDYTHDGLHGRWYEQTDWIIAHRDSDNIPYVVQLGDLVQHGDTGGGNAEEWEVATNAMYRLEKQSLTQRIYGIPYGCCVGNHDQEPNGDEDGTTTYYNKYFSAAHFAGKPYYGDHYDINSDTFYNTFSAGGMDFIVFSYEYGRYGSGVLDWTDTVLTSYPNHRIIVMTHHAGSDYTPSTMSAQGSAIYDRLKTRANFFMMLGGHVFNGTGWGEGSRSDTYSGHVVHTLVTDYQNRPSGGDSLMRLMYFSPANNTVSMKTYSPHTDTYETDSDSQFSFTYNMQPNGAGQAATAYSAIKTNLNVTPGSQPSFVWTNLSASKNYAWYVTVTDSNGDYATSTEWNFSTTSGFTPDANPNAAPNNSFEAWQSNYGVTSPDADDDGDGQSNLAEYIAHTNPTNANSALKIIDAKEKAKGHFSVTWSSVGGVRYRIQYSDNLADGFTDVERDAVSETDANPLGVTSTQSYKDDLAPTNKVRYYRVKVVP